MIQVPRTSIESMMNWGSVSDQLSKVYRPVLSTLVKSSPPMHLISTGSVVPIGYHLLLLLPNLKSSSNIIPRSSDSSIHFSKSQLIAGSDSMYPLIIVWRSKVNSVICRELRTTSSISMTIASSSTNLPRGTFPRSSSDQSLGSNSIWRYRMIWSIGLELLMHKGNGHP